MVRPVGTEKGLVSPWQIDRYEVLADRYVTRKICNRIVVFRRKHGQRLWRIDAIEHAPS